LLITFRFVDHIYYIQIFGSQIVNDIQEYINKVRQMSLSLDHHDTTLIAQNEGARKKRKRKVVTDGTYCDGHLCRISFNNMSTVFGLVNNLILATETKPNRYVSLCTATYCHKKHRGTTIDISDYVTTRDEKLFFAKILGLNKKKNRDLNVDFRKIIIALDYLCTNDTLNVIYDTMHSGYSTITVACAASIHDANQYRTEDNRIKYKLIVSGVNGFLAWYEMHLFKISTDRSQICQVFTTTILCHRVDRFGTRVTAYGASHIARLFKFIKGLGFICGKFAAAMAQKLPYVPAKDSGSVDVFIHDYSKSGVTENQMLVYMASWALEAGYVQDPRRSLDTITYKRDSYVPVVFRFTNLNVSDTLWNFATDGFRACLTNHGYVYYYPIAVKDWVDNTFTKSGFMVERLLYPHDRDHCRKFPCHDVWVSNRVR
jgi:hypothetical protein